MNNNDNTSNRSGFGSRIGFILAAAGSAVGLGNIWRFPYLAAKYGGGVFLLVYLIFAVTFGFSLMLTEIAIGRRTGKSVVGAYRDVNSKFAGLGWLAAIIPALILPYYCVIGGWVLKYMTVYVTGNGNELIENYSDVPGESLSFFENFITKLGEPAVFFIIYILLGAVVVALGVEKGIEKISKVLMPVLLLLIVGVGIYTLTLKGAGEGLKYYILPDFKRLTPSMFLKAVAAAVGQLFYSMSIAMGIMVTYGSYMRKNDSIEGSVRHIEIFDTLVAFLAGLIIVPGVFVFSGGDESALNKGPGLMFMTMPKVFDSMPGGHIIGAVFFVLVALAALTSSISLMETVTAVVIEKFKLSRLISCIAVTIFTIAVGMLSILGYSIWADFKLFNMQILDLFDFLTNNIMMPVLAFLTCIMIGYIVKPLYIEEEVESGGEKFVSKKLYRFMIKLICPICMIIILITPFVTDI